MAHKAHLGQDRSMSSAVHRYSGVAIALHWLIAAAIIFELVLGWRMSGEPDAATFSQFQLHKSVGFLILFLSLARIAWRLMHRAPALPADLPRLERTAAIAAHWAFYALMIGLPVTGWIIVSASPTNIPTHLFGLVHWPHLPGLPALPAAQREAWESAGAAGHLVLVWMMTGLLLLHVAAALRHHFVRRDAVLVAIIPRFATGRRSAPAAALGLTAAALGVGFAVLPPRVSENPATMAAQNATVAAFGAAEQPNWIVEPGGVLGLEAQLYGSAIRGAFERWTADIAFYPDRPQDSRMVVRVDLTSVRTETGEYESEIAGPAWLDAGQRPHAVFSATGAEFVEGDSWRTTGQLDLRGVQASVDLTFDLTITGDRAHAVGRATIDRTRFGVGQGAWTATDDIPADVNVTFDFFARRTPDLVPSQADG
jgi:cytochrome b561/polyisoprenoid-binding protein YceI